MKRRGLSLLICAVFVRIVAQIYAAEIPGTVRAVSSETITVAVTGDSVPNVGDKAEIFFKLAGVEGDISVATGSVIKVEGDSIQVKIEKATGEVAKDQLVRITSEKPQKRPTIVGVWIGDNPAGGKIKFEFREDATFVWNYDIEKPPS